MPTVKEKVLIVGAGGFGREVFIWCTQSAGYGIDWEVIGFLDDNSSSLDHYECPVRIVGAIDSYVPRSDERLICGVGIPKAKRKICSLLRSRGARFRSLIHPSAILGSNIKMGEGVVLCPRVTLTCDISLGDFVMFNLHAFAGHDVVVGAFSSVNGNCELTGRVQIGEDVVMGSGAKIIPGRRVGDGATIGAGSVVIFDVAAGVTVFGNPAKRIC